ncbi:armadillo-like helical domain-containing protein [Tanacetum coccineum]
MTVTAIKFLTIVSRSVHHSLFAGDEILQQITQSIVIPNVMLRKEDEKKYKDCAIYLVVYLATKKAGGASVSTDLVDIDSFFRTVIVPKLQGQDVNAFPMLKAGTSIPIITDSESKQFA